MTPPSLPGKPYTGALTTQHPNIILGSLQLMFWLFIHPASWRNHIARIDPTLRPDFSLLHLPCKQWCNRDLQRLFIRVHVICPMLVSITMVAALLVISALSWWPDALLIILYQALQVIAFSITSSIVLGAIIGVAFSAVFNMILNIIVGGIALSFFLSDMTSDALSESPALSFADRTLPMVIVVAIVMTISMALSMAYGTATDPEIQPKSYSFIQKTGGVIVGVLLGGIALLLLFVPHTNIRECGSASAVILTALSVGFRTRRWCLIIPLSVLFGNVFTAAYGLGYFPFTFFDITFISVYGLTSSVMIAFPYIIAEYLAGSKAGFLAAVLVCDGVLIASACANHPSRTGIILLTGLLGMVFGLMVSLWRPILFYPLLAAWNAFLYYADRRRSDRDTSLLPYHSAFWDKSQRLPLFGLDKHVLLVVERHPAEGQAAIDYLSTGRQRWAAQAVQIELEARQLERCVNAAAIGIMHQRVTTGQLKSHAGQLFQHFSRISRDINAALNQNSSYNQRLALSNVADHLKVLLRELNYSSDKYAVRFRPITTRWEHIIARKIEELTRQVEKTQEIDSPYIIGVPLTIKEEIFVSRTDISARIEQLLLDRRRPPLLLYGQRRMGKTSLLLNLGRLLPQKIIPLFVDLQGPISCASDHAGMLYQLTRFMVKSAQERRNVVLPLPNRKTFTADPFTTFDEWLDTIEGTLGESTALLSLDEFESLDQGIAAGRFNEAQVLGMLRNLIQHRHRFKVLLSGSHTLQEFRRWSSYLINVEVVHIGYLKENEARQLIEHPVKDFVLRYEPDAVQRVLDLTRGHPYLLQLLCGKIVALKNEQYPDIRRLAAVADVNAAVPAALTGGRFTLDDITVNQIDKQGEAVLRYMAPLGEGRVTSHKQLARQFPDQLEQTLALLRQRELIEKTVDGGYRFQVELIRQWFEGYDDFALGQ